MWDGAERGGLALKQWAKLGGAPKGGPVWLLDWAKLNWKAAAIPVVDAPPCEGWFGGSPLLEAVLPAAVAPIGWPKAPWGKVGRAPGPDGWATGVLPKEGWATGGLWPPLVAARWLAGTWPLLGGKDGCDPNEGGDLKDQPESLLLPLMPAAAAAWSVVEAIADCGAAEVSACWPTLPHCDGGRKAQPSDGCCAAPSAFAAWRAPEPEAAPNEACCVNLANTGTFGGRNAYPSPVKTGSAAVESRDRTFLSFFRLPFSLIFWDC